jgi:hypothetical protein
MLSAYSRKSIRAHINNPYAWNSRPHYRPPRKMPQDRCNLITLAIQQRHAVKVTGYFLLWRACHGRDREARVALALHAPKARIAHTKVASDAEHDVGANASPPLAER